MTVRRLEGLAVAGLTLLAAALRLWQIGTLPPGLHVDEAFNILDARRVLAGALPVFLPANAGRDVLYTYFQAPFLGLFGESASGARLASALIGALTVPATWWVARRLLETSDLPPARIRTVAILSAAILALSYWHIHFSRFGIRAILFPLVVVGVVGVWARVVSPLPLPPPPKRLGEGGKPRIHSAPEVKSILLLALLLGLAFYAHPAGRGLIALPLVDALYRWLRWRDVRPLKILTVAAAGTLLVAAPLLIYWWQHPWLFTSHAGEVSVLGQGAAAVARNALKVAGMFNLAGDPVRWRNLPGRPVFDVLTGLAFLLGLAIASRAAVRGASWASLALIWLGVLLVPSIVTDGAPNFSRAIGVLPVACMLAAVGMERVAHELERRTASRSTSSTSSPPPPAVLGEGAGGRGPADQRARGPASPIRRVLPAALLLAWLIVIGARTAYDYFVHWADNPETALAFDADKQALGDYYRFRTSQGAFVFVSPTMAEHPTVQVAAGRPPSSFDPREGWVLPLDAGALAEFAVLFNEFDVIATFAEGIFRPIHPIALPDRLRVFDIALHIENPSESSRAGAATQPGRLGPYARLADVAVPAQVKAGAAIPLRLEWDVLQPSDIPLHTAVQLQGLDGAGLGHGDGPPLGGSYPTDRWRPGERVVTTHLLQVNADAPPGPAELRIGWYAPPEGDRPFQPLVLDDHGTTVVVVGRTEVVP